MKANNLTEWIKSLEINGITLFLLKWHGINFLIFPNKI